jgi:hypothetical protein
MKFTNELQLTVFIVKLFANVMRRVKGREFAEDGWKESLRDIGVP